MEQQRIDFNAVMLLKRIGLKPHSVPSHKKALNLQRRTPESSRERSTPSECRPLLGPKPGSRSRSRSRSRTPGSSGHAPREGHQQLGVPLLRPQHDHETTRRELASLLIRAEEEYGTQQLSELTLDIHETRDDPELGSKALSMGDEREALRYIKTKLRQRAGNCCLRNPLLNALGLITIAVTGSLLAVQLNPENLDRPSLPWNNNCSLTTDLPPHVILNAPNYGEHTSYSLELLNWINMTGLPGDLYVRAGTWKSIGCEGGYDLRPEYSDSDYVCWHSRFYDAAMNHGDILAVLDACVPKRCATMDLANGTQFVADASACSGMAVGQTCLSYTCAVGFDRAANSDPWKCVYDPTLDGGSGGTKSVGGGCSCRESNLIFEHGDSVQCLDPKDETVMRLINPPVPVSERIVTTTTRTNRSGTVQIFSDTADIKVAETERVRTGTFVFKVGQTLPLELRSGSLMTVHVRPAQKVAFEARATGPDKAYDVSEYSTMKASGIQVDDGAELIFKDLSGVVESFSYVDPHASVTLENVEISVSVLQTVLKNPRAFTLTGNVTVVDSYHLPCAHIEMDHWKQWIILSEVRPDNACPIMWNDLNLAGGNNFWLNLTYPDPMVHSDTKPSGNVSVKGFVGSHNELPNVRFSGNLLHSRLTSDPSSELMISEVKLFAVPANVKLRSEPTLPQVSFKNVHWTCDATSKAVATFRSVQVTWSSTVLPYVTITEPAKATQRCSREQLNNTFGGNTKIHYDDADNTTDVTVVTIYTASGSIGAEHFASVSDHCFDFWGGPKYFSEWCNTNTTDVRGCGKIHYDAGSDYACDCGGCK
jgi:hypothetical protein